MTRSHAIILGGGYAGLLAAKVLASYYKRVSIIERYSDILAHPESTSKRQAVPQAAHIHVLLKGGQAILQDMFPTIIQDLEAHCPRIDWARDTEWHGPFGRYPQYTSGVETLLLSRSLLDNYLISHLQQIKNISIIIGNAKIIFDKNPRQAIGVNITDKQLTYNLFGDLIVDARGRRSNIIKNLNDIGLKTPPAQRVESTISYSSCIYQYREQHKLTRQLYLQVRPGLRHSGVVISPIEHGKIFVTIISLDQKPAQTNLEFINALTHLLGSSALSFLTHAQALTPIQVFRNFTNTRLNLGSLKKWPPGLLVIGDAACILNPVYGQGMTVAAQQIALLQQSLASPKKMLHWEHQFQRDIDASTNFPWLMATTEDLRAQNKSQLSYSTRFFQIFIDRILQRATTDQALHHSFLRVMHMLDPPYYLLKPQVFLRQPLSAKLTS